MSHAWNWKQSKIKKLHKCFFFLKKKERNLEWVYRLTFIDARTLVTLRVAKVSQTKQGL